MIRYKVVNKEHRCSTNENKGYTLYYKKGYIVRAIPGTIGIFVFRERYHAVNFRESFFGFRDDKFEIIRVRAFGRGKVPKCIGYAYSPSYLDAFYNNTCQGSGNVPYGTICYKSVEVLD